MCEETYEEQQKFIGKIQDPDEFNKFRMILANSACLGIKDTIIPDGPHKSYHAIAAYNPYASRFEATMYGRIINRPEGDIFEPSLDVKLKEKRAKEIAEILKTHIGEQICKTCPLEPNCKLEAGIREIKKSVHGSDDLVGTGFYTPIVKGKLDTDSI